MNDIKAAVPAVFAAFVGVVAGIASALTGNTALGLVAGIGALGAGVFAFFLARRLADARQIQHLLTNELRTAQDQAPVEQNEAAESQRLPESAESGAIMAGNHLNSAVLVDESTGLFSEAFFAVTLDARISAARRHLRPVAVVALEVVEGLPDEPHPAPALMVASTIRHVLRESDIASHIDGKYFALLLEDTPENGAIWTVERVRREILKSNPAVTVWAGVACYPAHAFQSDEIVAAAKTALLSAREWRQHRIEVAVAAD